MAVETHRPETVAGTRVRFYVEKPQERLRLRQTRPEAISDALSPAVSEYLEDRGWGAIVAITDRDEETAKAIKEVNLRNRHLPITAWITTPEQDGYWTTKLNVPQTEAAVKDTIDWANNFDLRFDSFGFCLQPPIEFSRNASSLNPKAISNYLDIRDDLRWQSEYGLDPEEEMNELLRVLKNKKIKTEAYVGVPPSNSARFGSLQTREFDHVYLMAYRQRFGKPAIDQIKPGEKAILGVYTTQGEEPGRKMGWLAAPAGRKKELMGDILKLNEVATIKNRSELIEDFNIFGLDRMIPQDTHKALVVARQK